MTDLPPAAQLSQMLTGCLLTQAVYAAAKFNLADHLAGGPQSIDQLAVKSGANASALSRLLRTLSSAGIFSESSPRTFALTSMAELLRSDVPGSQHAFALMMGDYCYKAIGEMHYSVQTGRTGFDHAFGSPLFDWLAHNPEAGKVFDAAMTGIHGPETRPMIDAYDFAAFNTIVDIGGGNASTITEILRACPKARGVVFDLPNVIERTKHALADAGLADRCRAESGDFFKQVAKAGANDAYILRHIIHDWDDEKSVTILKRCREAAAPGAKLLVVESVLPAANQPHPGKWLDLIMLTCPGGLERTAEEYQSLFARSGWKLTRIVPTKSPVSVVEGV